MTPSIKREICDCCNKNILIGQGYLECQNCPKIVHKLCFKKSKFSQGGSGNLCTNCFNISVMIYNPFKELIGLDTESDDKFYSEDFLESFDCINQASTILENCRSYKLKSIHEKVPNNTDFGTMFYNIDGNLSNFDSFSAELSMQKFTYSAIALAETNVSQNKGDLYKLSNYSHFYNDKIPNKTKGTGVCLYIHCSFNATINDKLISTTKNLESLFVTVNKGNEKVNVGVVYRSPNGDSKEFLNELTHLKSLFPKDTKSIILGDYNFDLLKRTNSTTQKFENLFLSLGFFPLISLATHSTNIQQHSCIDNILTNDIEHVTMSGVIDDMNSHHKPIIAMFNLCMPMNKNSSDQKLLQHYSFSKKNVDTLITDLQSKEDILANSTNFETFFDIFTHAIDSNCKLEKPKVSKRNPINNPWMTDGISEAISTKEELYDDWIASKKSKEFSPGGNIDLHIKFSNYRRCLKGVIKWQKNKYYCTKITDHKGDSKKTWEVINELRGKCKKTIKPQFCVNGVRITERRLIANKFNEYFASIASKLNEQVDGEMKIEPLPSFVEFLPKTNPNSMYLTDCTEGEISHIISELQNGKASDFPISVIKKVSHILSPVLSIQYNNLMSTGCFPAILKIGKISPIYKKDNEEQLQNYRPISTLPIFGKIFEKVIYSRLYGFLSSQGILHDSQFGFRKGHSTSHALNYSVHHIQQSLKAGNHVLGIFIDLSKAFDTIDHSILLKKLNTYGIRGRAHKLLESYLSNRKQYVGVLNETSDTLPVLFGVPQGSCLGPLLFLIYINDLTNSEKNSKFVLFADDTNIFIAAKSKNLAYKKANEVLSSVHRYMLANKLHINTGKSCYLEFSNSRSNKDEGATSDQEININGVPLERVHETKFLGVTIDEDLNWNAHRGKLAKKLATCCGMLNRIKDNIPTSLHKDLYHTLFESYLAYGITVWGGASNKKLEPLFKAQKMCTRIMFGDKEAYLDKFKTSARCRPYGEQILGSEFYRKEHTKPLFNTHEIMNVHNLYFYHCINDIFKVLKYRTPISLYSLFETSDRLGKETLILTPKPSDSYIYRAGTIWNTVRQNLMLTTFTCKPNHLKSSIKITIAHTQKEGEPNNWNLALNSVRQNSKTLKLTLPRLLKLAKAIVS